MNPDDAHRTASPWNAGPTEATTPGAPDTWAQGAPEAPSPSWGPPPSWAQGTPADRPPSWTEGSPAGPPPSWGPPPGYGPSGYGPAGYGPAGYGMAGYGTAGRGPGWRRPLNPLAPIALVLCFFGVLAPVGLGLGLMARRQIRETGQEGDGLALAAVVLGGIVSTLLLIGVVLWIVALTAIADGSLR